jgi:hypothetical protein
MHTDGQTPTDKAFLRLLRSFVASLFGFRPSFGFRLYPPFATPDAAIMLFHSKYHAIATNFSDIASGRSN